MEEFGGNDRMTFCGKALSDIANVMIHAKRFLKQKQARITAALLRSRHIGIHPSTVRNSEFDFFFL